MIEKRCRHVQLYIYVDQKKVLFLEIHIVQYGFLAWAKVSVGFNKKRFS